MRDKLEKLIKAVYKRWKADNPKVDQLHPDEETIACFLEDRLSQAENERMKEHLINCNSCAEIVAIQMKLETTETKQISEGLLNWAKDLVKVKDSISVLEIFLKLKEQVVEILNTTGDVLVGQEFLPAPVLRSRSIKDFKDEVIILKDFKDIRVEVKIENKQGKTFSLTVIVKEKDTQRIMKDLRVTLIKDDLELESYLTDSGKVTFEHILLGKYTVEISTVENKIASILLDIKT